MKCHNHENQYQQEYIAEKWILQCKISNYKVKRSEKEKFQSNPLHEIFVFKNQREKLLLINNFFLTFFIWQIALQNSSNGF
jgi:hypothetical protein